MSLTATKAKRQDLAPAPVDAPVEAQASPIAQREQRERELVQRVMGKSRKELEAACREAGIDTGGAPDETLRARLFEVYRGVPQGQARIL